MTPAEYATLVVLLAGALVATAMLVSWALEQRGLLAPADRRHPPVFDPDYVPPPEGDG